MRKFILIILLSLSTEICMAQPESTRQLNADEYVQRMLSRSDDGYTGWDVKALNKFGDASAVAITKYFAGKNPTINEIRLSLVILRESFSTPNNILIETDKKPRTALFVLDSFRARHFNHEIEIEIEDTRRSLLNIGGS